jgi:hypothetical protein
MKRLLPLLLAVGCAHQWSTGSTPHFKIHGDGSRGSLEDVLVRLEESYVAMTATFFPGVQIPTIEGMVFSEQDEFKSLTGMENVVGLFVPNIGATGSLLAVRGDAEQDDVDHIVAHELAHRLILQSYPRLPLFVNEGFALYLETVQVRRKGILFGAAPRGELMVANYGGAVSLAELLAAPGASMHGPDGHRYYASAWAFMHELIQGNGGRYVNRLPAALRAFEQVERSPRGIAEALAAIYPERTLPELEQAMFHEATRALGMGADQVVGVPFPRPTVNVTVAAADPAYIHELSGKLLWRLRYGR